MSASGNGSGPRLVLARHGRTAANVGRILDSRPPGYPLDELGEAQALQLAARLADRPLRAVYASRAVRTQQTAAPVAAAHGLPVTVLDGVQEVDIGDLEGRSDAAALALFDEVYRAWWLGDLEAHTSGGESALDLRARFLPAVEEIVGGVTDGDVLLVSHGAAVRLAAAALLGETAETFYVPNTGLVVLRLDPQGWALESWDTAEPVRGDVTAGGTPA
jgi:broad specificity phosphatase PhoE